MEQRYKRSLVEEEDLQWKLEQITSAQYLVISVQALNEGCIPRQPMPEGLEWNQQSKTLTQVREKSLSFVSFRTTFLLFIILFCFLQILAI